MTGCVVWREAHCTLHQFNRVPVAPLVMRQQAQHVQSIGMIGKAIEDVPIKIFRVGQPAGPMVRDRRL